MKFDVHINENTLLTKKIEAKDEIDAFYKAREMYKNNRRKFKITKTSHLLILVDEKGISPTEKSFNINGIKYLELDDPYLQDYIDYKKNTDYTNQKIHEILGEKYYE